MSYKWTADAVDRISSASMADAVEYMQKYPWMLSYDNVQIPFRVFSQRVDNLGEFGNGTAATIFIQPSALPLSPGANHHLQRQRAEGHQNPLTPLDIMDLSFQAEPHLQKQSAYFILRFLLESPEFNWKTYSGRDSSCLAPPPARHSLPHGKDHVTLQYLLGTVDIPEAAYEDHSHLIKEWLKQVGIDTDEKYQDLGLHKVIPIIGDQLTVDRLQGLFTFRAEDFNSFDRYDWFLALFGWFHLEMAFGKSLHKQYLGSSKGRGLKHAFELLQRKGLHTTSTKGPFHHHLSEAIYHVAEAHWRAEWLAISPTNDLKDFHEMEPEELISLASQLQQDCASAEALMHLTNCPIEGQDDDRRQTIMWNRDSLSYITLAEAIKHGDVGTMEDMLPTLLFRFIGGQSSNYTYEVLELLQGLHREWPAEICDHVRQNCWLVNLTGKSNSFVPIDKVQEHNIKDFKVYIHFVCL